MVVFGCSRMVMLLYVALLYFVLQSVIVDAGFVYLIRVVGLLIAGTGFAVSMLFGCMLSLLLRHNGVL